MELLQMLLGLQYVRYTLRRVSSDKSSRCGLYRPHSSLRRYGYALNISLQLRSTLTYDMLAWVCTMVTP